MINANKTSLTGELLSGSSLKSKIINLLANQHPLSPIKIHNILKKDASSTQGYQATYKSLKELENEGVLYKKNKEYELDLNWVEKIYQTLDLISQNYASKSGKKITSAKYIKTIEFDSISSFERYYYGLRKKFVEEAEKYKEDDRVLGLWAPHCYFALMDPKKEYEYLEKLKKYNAEYYIFSAGYTVLDSWVMDFYTSEKDSPVKMQLNASKNFFYESWLFPDAYYEVHFPPKFIKYMNRVYSKIERLDQTNFKDLVKGLHKFEDEKVSIVIHTDPERIALIRESIRNAFDKIKVPGYDWAKEKIRERVGNKKAVKGEIKKIRLDSESRIIKENNGKLYCLPIYGVSGLFNKNPSSKETILFGKRLCNEVKTVFHSKGFFSTDELPNYGITARQKEYIKSKFNAGKNDLVLFAAYDEKLSKQILNYTANKISQKVNLKIN